MKKYLDLIRIKHWIKNILIFIPIISARILDCNNILRCCLGWISFCFLSSFIYIINDLKDLEKDKMHSRKRNRPLPSGRIKKNTATVIAILMISCSLIINTIVNGNIINIPFFWLLGYLIINILYSFGFKNLIIWDVMILATSYIIRIYYGASLVDVQVSNWLFLTVLNASLFLGLGKRKKEMEQKENVREVLKEYNASFLDKFQYLCLALTLVFYSLWTIEQNIKYLIITIPIITIIFMKYCLMIEKSDEGDPTTILYQDKSLLLLCGLYGILMCGLLVY